MVSVTRLGDILTTRFISKEAQMIGNLLGYFEKPHSFVITVLGAFWATLEKFVLLFTPTFGHTGCSVHKQRIFEQWPPL